jgi:hypothetical protein
MWQPTPARRFGHAGLTRAAALPESFMSAQVAVCEDPPASERGWSEWGGAVRILVFSVLCLFAIAGTDYLVNTGLRRITTSAFGVFNRIVKGQINAEIVISGSSRALNHFDPRVIHDETGLSTFNIGINGSQTDMQVAVLKTYLKHNARPSLVVHSLDSFTFVTSRDGVWFPGQYLPYLKEDAIYQALSVVDADTWKARYLPMYGYAVEDMNFTWLTGVAGLMGRNPKEDRYLGFQPRQAQWTGDFARFKDGKQAGVEFKIEPQGVRDFEELMGLCKELDIPVLLVYSPVYYEMQDLEINRDQIFGRFKDVAQRYGAQLWDYRRSPISFRKDYFVNSEHLNADGAAVFSAEFGAALAGSGLMKARDTR